MCVCICHNEALSYACAQLKVLELLKRTLHPSPCSRLTPFTLFPADTLYLVLADIFFNTFR